MKNKILIVLLVISLCGLCACGKESEPPVADKSDDFEQTVVTPKGASEEEKESAAEYAALEAVLDYMEMMHTTFSSYDISATKYKIGSVTKKYGTYYVYGTLYLYDKYGSLKDTATFSNRVDLNSDGTISQTYYPVIDIK